MCYWEGLKEGQTDSDPCSRFKETPVLLCSLRKSNPRSHAFPAAWWNVENPLCFSKIDVVKYTHTMCFPFNRNAKKKKKPGKVDKINGTRLSEFGPASEAAGLCWWGEAQALHENTKIQFRGGHVRKNTPPHTHHKHRCVRCCCSLVFLRLSSRRCEWFRPVDGK